MAGMDPTELESVGKQDSCTPISKKAEAKSKTLQARRDYNRTARQQGIGL